MRPLLNWVLQSDHPVLDSRYLLYEAQQAHFYGLPADLALASVTTTSAEVAGFGHRLGYVKVGYDAGIYSRSLLFVTNKPYLRYRRLGLPPLGTRSDSAGEYAIHVFTLLSTKYHLASIH